MALRCLCCQLLFTGCKINEYRFVASDVSEEGAGVVLCVDDEQTLGFLEALFDKE